MAKDLRNEGPRDLEKTLELRDGLTDCQKISMTAFSVEISSTVLPTSIIFEQRVDDIERRGIYSELSQGG